MAQGGWSGEPIQFFRWFCHIYKLLKDNYNLKLTFNVRYCNNFLEFLDVNYRFVNNILNTDVYHKDTDAHRYLSYLSTHPPHTFKSVIYSSFLRLRRIVIDQNLLEFRLLEMHSFLKASDYPDNLLCSIRNDVFSKERDINYRNRATDRRFDVGWVTTFGPGYGEVKKLISRINRTLLTSPLFSEIEHPVLGGVSRRAPSLRDILFSQRNICLDTGRGLVTTRCTAINSRGVGRPCSSCDLMSEEIKLTIEHSIRTMTGFNSLYKFFIIRHVEKEQLVISEQFFINKYFTYKPYGLNVSNPIGLTNYFKV